MIKYTDQLLNYEWNVRTVTSRPRKGTKRATQKKYYIDDIITCNKNIYGSYIHGIFDEEGINKRRISHMSSFAKLKTIQKSEQNSQIYLMH